LNKGAAGSRYRDHSNFVGPKQCLSRPSIGESKHFEHVEKPGHELVLDEVDQERVFPITAYTVGYVRDLAHGGGIDVGLGGQITINDVPEGLDRYYGNDLPYSFQVFLRIRPSLMSDHGMTHGEMAPNEK